VFFLFALFGFPPVLEIKFDNLYFKDILSFFFGGTRTFKILTLSPVYVCVYVTGMMNIFLSVNVYVLCHAFFFFFAMLCKNIRGKSYLFLFLSLSNPDSEGYFDATIMSAREDIVLFIIVTCFSLFLFF